MPPKSISVDKVAIIGTYLPQRCGIATFSSDLHTALRSASPETEVRVVAVRDGAAFYDYPPEVQFEIGKKSLPDYRATVDFLNRNAFDVVSLQHEFGIFGGRQGNYILRLLQDLRMPVVTTLHTVLEEPDADQRDVLSAIGELSDRVIVMSKRARSMLARVYGVPRSRIAVIPHGVPDMPFLDPSYHKERYGLAGRKVILTFGLISRGKGLESVIEAMPRIVAEHPDAVFVIAGETHPGVLAHEGNSYREELKSLAEKLGVDENVIFRNEFLDIKSLTELLTTADICVTPYLNPNQIVSGALSYALGAGKAIVSTPYSYAEEVLDEGRGRLVPFRDSAAIGEEIAGLLADDAERLRMRKRAYDYSRRMVWKNVGEQYVKVLRDVRRERGLRPRAFRMELEDVSLELPAPRLQHLSVLSDDTGILQHAKFTVPDRDHGYCTDDNARALIVAVMAQRSARGDQDLLQRLAGRYLGFLQHAFNPDTGRFRNFMTYDRRWLEDVGSEDSHGRALWALGYAANESPRLSDAAAALFDRALPVMTEIQPLRAVSFALIGLDAFLRRYSGSTPARRARAQLAERLHAPFKAAQRADWPWPEDTLTYANGVLPHALIAAGSRLEDAEMLDTGLRALRWLLDIQIDPKGHFVPVGNAGWMTVDGHRARFDQQPIEAQHMVDAVLEAYRVTGDERWVEEARRCLDWFLGRNDLGQPVCDASTGGCRDGLHADGVNQNQGAESTLAWLHSLLRLHQVQAVAVATTAPAEIRRRIDLPRLPAAGQGLAAE
ncbi:MAG TPA: glycosyltransferase [Bauldia sp.]|nr:glycosyltransferase [Bauldia sp.]